MKTERILNILGQVDDKYILEAAPNDKSHRRKVNWMKWGTLAACLLLCLTPVYLLHNLSTTGTTDKAESILVMDTEPKEEAAMKAETGTTEESMKDTAAGQIETPESQQPQNAPNDFYFTFTWGTYGESSYDSKTGKLVKTTNATNPDEYITTLQLSDETLLEIYNIILSMDIISYPDEYDPYNDPESETKVASEPSRTIILSVHSSDMEKTITCNNILFEGFKGGYNSKADSFIDLCNRLTEIIIGSEEWQTLPEYEFYYE